MKITAFTDADGEPVTIDPAALAVVNEDGGIMLAEVVADATLRGLDEIHVVSENVATIALHALHGVLTATDEAKAGWPEDPAGLQVQVTQARAWALAALRELAFYDRDGIDTTDASPDGKVRSDSDPSFTGDSIIASDPGREAVDAIRCGTRLTQPGTVGTEVRFYVDWPDA